jgi:hypothetical protein
MARLRTFIAVDLGKELRGRCVVLQETLSRAGADVKWVEEENLHVTLLFLGEVRDRTLSDVCRAVALVAGRHEGFTLGVETTGCFPNPRRPRVVWAGIGAGAAELVWNRRFWTWVVTGARSVNIRLILRSAASAASRRRKDLLRHWRESQTGRRERSR